MPLYPFFLEGVAADAKLNQADGMHPTAEGVRCIVKHILPTVEAFLGTIQGNAVEKQARNFAQGITQLARRACFAESHNCGKNSHR